MLTVITVRKCGRRLSHFRAACRDLRREVAVAAAPEGTSVVWEAPGLDPTPAEAAIWAETLDQILTELRPSERPIVQMRLQGYDIAEIAAAVNRSERTVLRVLEGVRTHLEQISAEDDESE
jgi:DNA-directed RNA polymerase specialized sigma24 family protein